MIVVEIWKNINDRYSVSNLGNVKSNYAGKERLLKPFKDARGYLKVDLRNRENRKTVFVHRLVAEHFISNLENLPEVNHKDENKENNCVNNLEYCTTKYNCNYGTRNKRKAEGCQKKVYSLDKDGTITYYNSRNEAGKILGIDATAISKALSDNYPQNKTAGGKQWFYAK